MSDGQEQSRKQFENWYQGDIGWSMRFHRDGDRYTFSGTEKSWQSWQASRVALAESSAEQK